MVAAKLANLEQGARTDIEPSANLQKVSRAQAAEKLNLSERTVNAAKKVQQQATPELQEKVEQGMVSVSAAADVATLPNVAWPQESYGALMAHLLANNGHKAQHIANTGIDEVVDLIAIGYRSLL